MKNSNLKERDKYYDSLGITSDRVVLHSDLNNFFASVEMLFEPSLKNVPMAICGDEKERHGIILAKNNLAKHFGIKTGEPVKAAREKCRSLVTRPSRYPEYVKYSRAVREIYLRYTPCVEPFGIDEAWLDVSGEAKRRGGALFESAEKIACEIRDSVLKETGLCVSVGVSFNKIFSKLASDMKKNNAVTVISPDNYTSVVGDLSVRDMLYIGKNTEELLKQNRLYKLSDVAKLKRSHLSHLFGKSGEQIWDFARGLDFSPVAEYTTEENTKSVSNSRTLPYDVTELEDAKRVLFSLCESVCERIRERGMTCSEVSVFVRTNDLKTLVRQKKLDRETDLLFEIYEKVLGVFNENFDFSKPIRGFGVGLDKLKSLQFQQISVFDSQKEFRNIAVNKALDNLRKRYGALTPCPASALVKKELSEFDKKHPSFNHNL